VGLGHYVNLSVVGGGERSVMKMVWTRVVADCMVIALIGAARVAGWRRRRRRVVDSRMIAVGEKGRAVGWRRRRVDWIVVAGKGRAVGWRRKVVDWMMIAVLGERIVACARGRVDVLKMGWA